MNASHYIGMMSGTSMDGIDAVLMRFSQSGQTLLADHRLPWPEEIRQELRAIAVPGENEIDRLGVLDLQVGELFATAAQELLRQAGFDADAVAAIGCHGQTIRHRPNGPHPFTLQIGDPNRIAERTGITTVADFRRRDMAAGGQGAPLVPAYHAALFRDPNENRAVLNLGGIANLTILPAAPEQPVRGFDTGPGNTLLDAWAYRTFQQPCDRDGKLAAAGRVQEAALEQLLADPYFRLPPPKSTGPEQFHLAWVESRWNGMEALSPADVQATLSALTVESVCRQLETAAPECARLIACGGGVFNRELMGRLAQRLGGIPLETTEAFGIAPQLVEAAAFAWLAYQTLRRRPGNLPPVTGARHPAVLGGIYPGSPQNRDV
jgi:anhydro-N-acetylmuramic acid kinase